MRFVWAVMAFFVAAVLIGAGIAQRTIFDPPAERTEQITTSSDAPYTLIDGQVLTSVPGAQQLRIHDSSVFLSYGRTSDLTAWLSKFSYNRVTLGPNAKPTVSVVPASSDPVAAVVPRTDLAAATADEKAMTSPQGSDLWMAEYNAKGSLETPLQVPATMSVLVASDGTAAAPSVITIAWPVTNRSPWAFPLIVMGAIALIIGIVLYLLAIRHARRSRGPRRKGLPELAPTEPINVLDESSSRGVIASQPRARRRARSRRRFVIVLPAVVLGSVLLAGCAGDAHPAPSDTATAQALPDGQPAPVVTAAQASDILDRVRSTLAQADQGLNIDIAATRAGGAMLDALKTNYQLRAKIKDYQPLANIPQGKIYPILPQANALWPRTFMAVITDAASDTKTATIMMLTQADPWTNYHLLYAGTLLASTQLPDLAPDFVGTALVPPDTSFLAIAPDELAAAYADLLTRGSASPQAGLFDEKSDTFSASVAADRKKRLDAFNTSGAQTGSLTFSAEPGSSAPLSLATLQSGAIVAVTVNEIDTAKPNGPGITISSNQVVSTLTGVSQSPTGFISRYADQLFFYVPASGSSDKIRLLGYNSSFLDAKVIG